jgi:hypothetical protein
MAGGGTSVRAIFAMGEVAARLQEAQDSSRAEFAALFERFSRRSAPRRSAPPGPRRTAPVTPAAALAGGAR